MAVNTKILKSKINLLNATIAQFHDSGLFNPAEISDLTAPVLIQINDAHQLMTSSEVRNMEVIDAEVVTPQSPLH